MDFFATKFLRFSQAVDFINDIAFTKPGPKSIIPGFVIVLKIKVFHLRCGESKA